MTRLKPPDPGKYLRREVESASAEYYRRLADGQLATTRCSRCDQGLAFPPLEHCPACGSPMEWVPLSRTGMLYAYTTQDQALRFSIPIVVALAEVDTVVIPGICDVPYGELRIGQAVDIEIQPIPELGLHVLRFSPSVDQAAPSQPT